MNGKPKRSKTAILAPYGGNDGDFALTDEGMMMNYGEKRNYPKIDIFWRGDYKASTTWAKTCREAKERFLLAHTNLNPSEVKCWFAK